MLLKCFVLGSFIGSDPRSDNMAEAETWYMFWYVPLNSHQWLFYNGMPFDKRGKKVASVGSNRTGLGSGHYLHHPGGREKTREGHEHFTFWMGRVMNILNFQQGGSWTFCLMGRVMNFFPRGEGRELHFFPNKSVRNSKIFGAARQYNWQWSMVFNTTCKMVILHI